MNLNLTSIRTSVDTLRAVLPTNSATKLRQPINRAIQLLPRRDRWRHLPWAMLCGLLGLAFAVAVVLTRSDLLAIGAGIGLIGAVALALRLAPAQLEAQIVQTERDTEKMISEYEARCQQEVGGFVAAQRSILQTVTAAAVKDGMSLSSIREDLGEIEQSLRANEAMLSTFLEKQRATVKQRRDEYQIQRSRFTASTKRWMAYFLPGLSRGAARVALEALAKLNEAATEEVQSQAVLEGTHDFAEAASSLGRNHGDALPLVLDERDKMAVNESPYWLGIPLPPTEVVEAAAIHRIEQQLPQLRQSLLMATAQGKSAEDAIQESVETIFNQDQPWPTTVQQFVGSLNGEMKFFADRLCKEAAEWPPSVPIPGRDRHRRLFVLSADGPNSGICSALRDRMSDAVSIIGLEHIEEEFLMLSQEVNCVLAEIPEAKGCVDAFRSLSREHQSLLITACENDDDLLNYYPELAEDNGRPARLMACALSLGIISRSGSQEYRFAGRTFAKGYEHAVEVLHLDQCLAARVEDKVEETASRDGFGPVVGKLTAAKDQPTTHVPKDVVEQFQIALEDAIAEFKRRTTTTTPTYTAPLTSGKVARAQRNDSIRQPRRRANIAERKSGFRKKCPL